MLLEKGKIKTLYYETNCVTVGVLTWCFCVLARPCLGIVFIARFASVVQNQALLIWRSVFVPGHECMSRPM